MHRARLVAELSSEIKDKRVLAAMARVPRECFVNEPDRGLAYEDRPLPIGLGQTISQPFIVAKMTEALELSGHERVLDIGTGSGYQTAILAELVARVITVERLPYLATQAKSVLKALGYRNIEFHLAGDELGSPEQATYDAILVSAAAPRVPKELLAQLALNGKLIIPVGSRYLQELCRITRRHDKYVLDRLGACRFVSLIGKGAWEEQEVH